MSTSGVLFCIIQEVANACPSSVFRSLRNSTSLRYFGRRSRLRLGCCSEVLRNSLLLSIELIRSDGDLIVVAVLYLTAVTLGVFIVGIWWRLEFLEDRLCPGSVGSRRSGNCTRLAIPISCVASWMHLSTLGYCLSDSKRSGSKTRSNLRMNLGSSPTTLIVLSRNATCMLTFSAM